MARVSSHCCSGIFSAAPRMQRLFVVNNRAEWLGVSLHHFRMCSSSLWAKPLSTACHSFRLDLPSLLHSKLKRLPTVLRGGSTWT
mmetsp:Transcript_76040/g.192953  ORF Transcript_76040/g.192953 Transcript_76040/m.192953 type:complete len:85 (-) Transcript_76040:143-397(-)